MKTTTIEEWIRRAEIILSLDEYDGVQTTDITQFLKEGIEIAQLAIDTKKPDHN